MSWSLIVFYFWLSYCMHSTVFVTHFIFLCNCCMHSTIFVTQQQYYILVSSLVVNDVKVVLITKVILNRKCIKGVLCIIKKYYK